MQLNPHYPAYYLAALGRAYVWAGQYSEAIPLLQQAINHDPNWLVSHLLLVISYSELGRVEEAQVAAATVRHLSPHFSVEAWQKMAAHVDLG